MYEKKYKLFLWLYRTFTFILPAGYVLYSFLISKLIDNDITITAKIGISGIFTLILILCLAIFFVGRFCKTRLEELNIAIRDEIDNNKKIFLIKAERKIKFIQEIFRNSCFVVIFIIMWATTSMIEVQALSLRGDLLLIVCSLIVGFCCNVFAQLFKMKR